MARPIFIVAGPIYLIILSDVTVTWNLEYKKEVPIRADFWQFRSYLDSSDFVSRFNWIRLKPRAATISTMRITGRND